MSSCTTSGVSIGAVVIAAVLVVQSCGPSKNVSTNDTTPPVEVRVATGPIDAINDGVVHDLPGVHNVLVQAGGDEGFVLSGGLPEGDTGFATLASLGIKTVISVDAAPVDLDAAKAHGLRYVQIPTEYAGVSSEAAETLAVALRDLDGPVYIHCHHGKHRAPAAAALALVETGRLTNDEALARLKAAGTSPDYPGLYRCVAEATAYSEGELASLSASLPERAEVGSFIAGMAIVDRDFEKLESLKVNGWRVPEDHPDLSPVAIAATVESTLRDLSQRPSGGLTPPIENWNERQEFTAMMTASAERASELESAIAATDWIAATTAWSNLKASCTACHRVYRNPEGTALRLHGN